MPSLAQKALMLSPVSFCLLISSKIFDLFIIFKCFGLKIVSRNKREKMYYPGCLLSIKTTDFVQNLA